MSIPATLDSWKFETLTVQIDGAVLLAEMELAAMLADLNGRRAGG